MRSPLTGMLRPELEQQFSFWPGEGP